VTDTQCLSTDVCIVGGGPCGVMLGVLLARAGVDVIVLEKYPDFFRDFRGDTVHPSTLQLLFELGWLDDFLRLPHSEIRDVSATIAGEAVHIADVTHLPTHCKFVALMPQWDFLNFLAQRGRRYPTFHLMMQTDGVGLIESENRVTGVHAKRPDGEVEIAAKLVVGADGRHSTIRDRGFHRRRSRRADGRALDASSKARGRSGASARHGRNGSHARDARPRRLLAMRIHHSQGRLRRAQGQRN